ncbi:MAG: hypothetical protein J6J43_02450 [Oscillospiraceae bacterium]|nr:hypothetical protein [Oscillospiraceae bacterium]
MKKSTFYTELAYVLGIVILALGTALMERADLGVSMVVAPAYLLHLKLVQIFPFFSFGMAEYTLQAVVLLLMIAVLRKARLYYLFSFVTAVIYGFTLDGAIALAALLPVPAGLVGQLLNFLPGMLLCSIGVCLLFQTYIPPEVYELFVKELSAKFGWDIHKCKTCYDCVSCLVAVVLSFLFFGLWHFEGVKLGTVFCALFNGALIHVCTKFFDHFWAFRDRFPAARNKLSHTH